MGGFQQLVHSPGQSGLVLQLAFPNDDSPPAELSERQGVAAVPSDIGLEFGKPEIRPCLRDDRIAAVPVPVPEAAVNEDP